MTYSIEITMIHRNEPFPPELPIYATLSKLFEIVSATAEQSSLCNTIFIPDPAPVEIVNVATSYENVTVYFSVPTGLYDFIVLFITSANNPHINVTEVVIGPTNYTTDVNGMKQVMNALLIDIRKSQYPQPYQANANTYQNIDFWYLATDNNL